MGFIDENRAFLTRLLDMLEQHFGNTCEVVLHDLTKSYDHTIIDIRNGHITGRKIGDCGSSIGLEILRNNAEDADHYNYISHNWDAKVLRSSSLYIREKGKVVGAICLNSDITQSLQFESYLRVQNNYASADPMGAMYEFHASDVKQLLEYFLAEGEKIVGKAAPQMERADKMRFLKYLDEKGAFLITKSSDRVCDFLGVSRFTLYSYLETIRGESEKEEEANDEHSREAKQD